MDTQKRTPAQALELVSLVMDRLFSVPGTELRFGLNSLLMLVPVLGDTIPTVVSIGILMVAFLHYRVPRIVAVRMVLNSALDASLGWIPVIGDAFDLFFKADTRNVRLLEQYVGTAAPKIRSTWGDWFFVIMLLGSLFLLLALIFYGLITLMRVIFHAF
jgi:hypothetical protein